MNRTYATLNLGHARVTYQQLVDTARTNVTRMTGNPFFPAPIPSLAEITAAADRLSLAVRT
jgi:hypothetical protein